MILISLSFSGKDHEGARMPRLHDNDQLHKETIDEFIHKKKKRKRKGLSRRDQAIPYSHPSQDPDPSDQPTRTNLWLARREKQAPPKKDPRIRKAKYTLSL